MRKGGVRKLLANVQLHLERKRPFRYNTLGRSNAHSTERFNSPTYCTEKISYRIGHEKEKMFNLAIIWYQTLRWPRVADPLSHPVINTFSATHSLTWTQFVQTLTRPDLNTAHNIRPLGSQQFLWLWCFYKRFLWENEKPSLKGGTGAENEWLLICTFRS